MLEWFPQNTIRTSVDKCRVGRWIQWDKWKSTHCMGFHLENKLSQVSFDEVVCVVAFPYTAKLKLSDLFLLKGKPSICQPSLCAFAAVTGITDVWTLESLHLYHLRCLLLGSWVAAQGPHVWVKFNDTCQGPDSSQQQQGTLCSLVGWKTELLTSNFCKYPSSPLQDCKHSSVAEQNHPKEGTCLTQMLTATGWTRKNCNWKILSAHPG